MKGKLYMKSLLTGISLFSMLFVATEALAAGGDKLVFSTTEHAAERQMVIDSTSYKQYIAQKMLSPDNIGIALYDLNGDGNPEVISYTQSSLTCGAHGCDLKVFETGGGKPQILLEVTAAETVEVSQRISHGSKGLILGGPRGASLWSFDGKAYNLAGK